jgi:hypothetical protein
MRMEVSLYYKIDGEFVDITHLRFVMEVVSQCQKITPPNYEDGINPGTGYWKIPAIKIVRACPSLTWDLKTAKAMVEWVDDHRDLIKRFDF